MRKNTFTLVEMLCVVGIIAILCGIVFGASSAIRNRNAEIKTRATLKQIEVALNECKQKFGYYPQSTSSAFADMEKEWFFRDNDDVDPADDSATAIKKKYSAAFKKSCNFTSFEIKDGKICDAYGEPLQYKSNGKTFEIYSKGQDGKSTLDGEEIKEDDEKNEDNIYLD